MNSTRDSKLENDLEAIEECFAILADAFLDAAVYLLDANGRIRKTNVAAEDISGYGAIESIGQNISILYKKRGTRCRSINARSENGLREARLEHRGWRVRKDGSLFQARMVTSVLKNLNGQIYGFIHTMRYPNEETEAQRQPW